MPYEENPGALAAALERRRGELAAAWSQTDAVVLIGAGQPVPRPGRGDITYPFGAHTEYLWLTDRNRAGGVMAFDPADGFTDFVAPVTAEEVLWSGAPADTPSEGQDVAGLPGWLEARSGRPLALLGCPPAGLAGDPERARRLRYALDAIRRRKDAVELDRLRAAAAVTAAGYAEIVPQLQAGRTEREIQIELELAFLRHGGTAMAYDSIVGSGPNSAVLHGSPGPRPFAAGEFVLFDAGAEVRNYVSDVSRTYPVGGALDAEHAEWHAIVLGAQQAAIAMCTVGTEWLDVHRAAGVELARGLIEFGLLRGDPEELVASGAIRLFFPHGIGHLVGLGVRDVVGALPGRAGGNDSVPRIDLPLEPGHVVTVEPGLYIVPALLAQPELRERHRDAVDWARAEAMSDFGGVRIEDNIHVTPAGPENLTAAIPSRPGGGP
ncbi:MAG TPA: aminopeptidase P N-terminal domain-containing protein [Solirubrobacteraceae bacterium]|nr:aminopeptidase P N-terminal domain-containing protein [Solirubrobacteraceae bacterium]